MPAKELYYTNIRDTGLVGYWRMEGNSSDSSGSGSNGTDTTISYGTAYGLFGQGATFNGTSSLITFADASLWRPTSSFSVSGWLNTTTTNIGGVVSNTIISTNDYSGWVISINGTTNKLLFTIYPSNGTTQNKTVTSSVSVNTGVWVHFVAVYDGTYMYLYIDGKLDVTPLASGAPSYDATENPIIGKYTVIGTDYFYLGNLDDISIFNRVLTPWEIYQLAQGHSLGEFLPSSSTKEYLPLNGNSADASGNANNGADTDMSYGLAYGKFGQGALFNAGTSFINVTDAASLKFGTGNFTISAWVNVAANGVRYAIVHKGMTKTGGYLAVYQLMRNTDNTFYVYADNGNAAGAGYALSSSVTTTTIGVWYNVIFTKDGKTVNIYVNGKLEGTASCSGATLDTDNTEPLMIGRQRNQTSGYINYFNGNIDEVIIENRAWSASEIKKYYTYAKGRFGIL
jgi:hypothetical protein